MAEYGCSDPEETFSIDGDWIGTFNFAPDSSGVKLYESGLDPACVIVRAAGEFDKKCRIGCIRKMQDLSGFDGDSVVRAFAVGRHSGGLDVKRVAGLLTEDSEIVLEGSKFAVRRVHMRNGYVIAESRRIRQSGKIVCDFPADILERLDGPCRIPRRDEQMFRDWKARIGGFSSYEILGESRWCDEPAFGEPCECVKVLLRLNESLGVFSYSKMWKDFKDLFA